MSPLLFLLVVLSGTITGTLGALLGIGGGIFLIPVLVMGFGLPMHEAVATSVVTIIATSSATASVYVDKGISNIRLGMTLEVMTTVGAVLGGITANHLPGDILRSLFAFFLLFMAGLMWRRTRARNVGAVQYDPAARISGAFYDAAEKQEVRYSVRRLPTSMMASLLAGNLSGLLGIGGGLVKVPVMHAVSGVPMKAATATSNFMIGVTAVASAFIYFSYGHLNPLYTAAAVLGVLSGTRFGTMLGMRLHSRTIVMVFIVLIIIVAVRMVAGEV
ncbi:MAG: sulfite exporter TauE/SafE family protein [Bacteroidetes bacterium]|nr:sulfite exporter TauE/SafE family protein [Bacteroidota bacterium]